MKIHRTFYAFLLNTPLSEHGSELLQTSGASRADAGDRHTHHLSDLFVCWIGPLEIKELKQTATPVRKLVHSAADILLFLSSDLNVFDIHCDIRGFFEILVMA